MSNQIVISSGAKVRSLEGVLTGSAGIVSSVPLGGANGVATLDSSGKVPLSQLPASVVTYLGTWNAATNTPTLANGTGDVGDLYICNVAGTVNFGAGPITFAVGDWVIYNGSQWQKSAGQNGTVTSVAVTSTGNDAISITGSPITTAGTINIGFTGDNTQYVNGAGDLTTFPSLTGFVPYTGATQTLDMGAFDVNARGIKVNGTAGSGHVDFKHQSGNPTGSASSTTMFADTNGNMAWKNDHNYITTLASNLNTADRTYTFPDANGTIALTSNLTSYVPYSGATTNVNLGSYGLSGNGDFVMGSVKSAGIFAESGAGAAGYLYLKGDSSFGLLSGYNSIFANGFKYGFEAYGGSSVNSKRAYLDFGSLTNNTTRTYTFPNASGTLALTSDIPSLSGYVPYTGATSSVSLGSNNLTATTLFTSATADGGLWMNQASAITGGEDSTTYTSIKAYTNRYLYFSFGQTATYKRFRFDVNGLSDATTLTYTMPNASGTLALTSDIPSLANYVTTNTNQTISGIKTFSNEQLFGNGITLTGGYITYTSGSFNLTLNTNLLTANRNVYIKDGSGTLAFTSDIPSLSGYVQGSGTTNYLSKFTASGTIGNSLIYDNGTNVTVGNTNGARLFNIYSATADNHLAIYGSAPSVSLSDTATSATYQAKFGLATASGQFATGAAAGDFVISCQTGSTIWAYNSVEKMRLNTNGRLLIGTTTDSGYLLDVNGTLRATGAATFSSSVMAGGQGTFTTATTVPLIAETTGGNSGLMIKTSATTTNWLLGGQYNVGNGFEITPSTAAGGTTFSTPALVIKNTGNVGIGTSSPGFQLSMKIVGSANALLAYYNAAGTATSYIGIPNGSGDVVSTSTNADFCLRNDTGNILFATNGNTERMRITSGGWVTFEGNGNGWTIGQASGVNRIDNTGSTFRCLGTGNGFTAIAASAFNVNSDYRLKEDLKEFNNSIDILNSIKIYDFKWKDRDERNYGVIAHELQEVLPYIVYGEKDGLEKNGEIKTQGVDYGKLVPVLVKAIQEQQAQIEELKALINK